VATVYLQGSVASVYVSPTGHTHGKSAPADDNIPFAIDCPPCESFLVRELGAVYDRRSVPLTDRQVDAREQAKEEGDFAVALAAKELARGALAAANGQTTRRGRRSKTE
jgi:hypothetical protein